MGEFSGDRLACVRGERAVFGGLSFRIASGDALVLTGANGSGKSSLLRILAGLLPQAEGRLLWDGRDVAGDAEAHRARVRWVGHADAVKTALTTAENLRTWAVLWGGAGGAAERVEAALAAFGIERLADVPGRWLSAGQRRRLALARLLVAPAAIWLLDEPRTALDAEAVGCLDAAVARHRAEGGLVVVALHGEGRPPSARVLELDDGWDEAC